MNEMPPVFLKVRIRTILLHCVCILNHFSHVQPCHPMDHIACQAFLSMGFSRQEYWSGLPCPPPGDIPDPGIKPKSLMSPALAGRFFTTSMALLVKNPPVSLFYSKKKNKKKSKNLHSLERNLMIPHKVCLFSLIHLIYTKQ